MQEEVIVFTCGLMKDPTPLVNHVYEAYVEMASNSCWGYTEIERRIMAQGFSGKHINSTNLFNILYTESRVPLFGHAKYNQFVYITENHEGEIVTPSRLYEFEGVSEDNVPLAKFDEQEGSEAAPECILMVQEPDAAATRSLFLTCCKISKRQPVTHLFISDATCKDLTPAEAPALSRNVQVVYVKDCDFPMVFWKKILHQLFDCVNLQGLMFENTNLNELEEDLDQLFQNFDGNTGLTNHNVEVYLSKNNLSETFVKKWNGSSSGIICNFLSDSSDDEDELTLDEVNWLIEEQAHPGREINLSRQNLTADVVNALKISEPVGQLIMRDCGISDGTVFETFLGVTASNFLTVLDLSDTKLGHNAIHISYIVAHGNLKQLHLPHCEIPTTALDLILPLLPRCKELTHLNLYGKQFRNMWTSCC